MVAEHTQSELSTFNTKRKEILNNEIKNQATMKRSLEVRSYNDLFGEFTPGKDAPRPPKQVVQATPQNGQDVQEITSPDPSEVAYPQTRNTTKPKKIAFWSKWQNTQTWQSNDWRTTGVLTIRCYQLRLFIVILRFYL